jgi:hypothetical protein
MATDKTSFNQLDAVSLREHLQLLISKGDCANAKDIDALSERVTALFAAQKTALEKAEISMFARLEVLNNHAASLRQQQEDTKISLEKQSGMFFTKAEAVLFEKATNSSSDELQRRLGVLENNAARLEGKASQTSVMIMGFLTVISLLISIVTFIMRFTPSG